MPAQSIDKLMESASQALVATDYFEAEALCLHALERAFQAGDTERMARILLPLQESRRQRRHEAVDSGVRRVLTRRPAEQANEPGLYVCVPPLKPADAHAVREDLKQRRVPALVLFAQSGPQGAWEVVAETRGRRWACNAPPPATPPSEAWIIAAEEALGDEAISRALALPAHEQIRELAVALEAIPEHEKLHQRLGELCRQQASALAAS